MEEFKIIKLPTKEEPHEEEMEQEPILKKRVDDGNYNPPKKRYIFLILFIILVIIGFFVMRMVTTYTDYEVENSWERDDSSESVFMSYNNNVLKYSSDGIFYTKYDGSLIWNYTYNMTNPGIDTCGDYIVVFDKKGTELDIFSSSGYINTITSTTPILDVEVAEQGTVALLLQENGVSYIQMYDTKATLLVSGELHPENNGFPISMALSSDATRLLLSMVTIDQGELSSQLIFYDFTSEGKEKEDNIVAKYTYVDMLIPEVDYVKGDKALAFADSKIIIFNNNSTATIAKEITLDNEAKSIFHNDSYFGYVCEVTAEDGTVENQMNVYNLYGFRRTSKTI